MRSTIQNFNILSGGFLINDMVKLIFIDLKFKLMYELIPFMSIPKPVIKLRDTDDG
ncbi:hypothetical protein FC21_GL001053 [Limosilactobacillus equigenerosi DSM 18793 = JCM 14505]|uniref:Uncharacterized protein n=1 Tax=Limosilactobacillus equigenerosi DSM 18793 = JCM 14505 TaxID=1423742 RepID=A0A0R1UP41_9LACO|nr:hypothetical protein FC21_GL001053 [Limosilactobacillus equigenerosi DSM 18793 = JCM 14505]